MKGYTGIPHGFHSRIGEFKDGNSYARLAVWLYHRARESKEGTSYPSVPRIAADLKLDDDTVTKARNWLRKNGWMKTVSTRASSGEFAIKVEQTIIPAPGKAVPGSTGDRTPNEPATDTPVQPGTVQPGEEVTPQPSASRFEAPSRVEVTATATAQHSASDGVQPDAYRQDLLERLNALSEFGYESEADPDTINRIASRLEAEQLTSELPTLFDYIGKAKWILNRTSGRLDYLADRLESDDKRSLLNQYRKFTAGRKRHEVEKKCPGHGSVPTEKLPFEVEEV